MESRYCPGVGEIEVKLSDNLFPFVFSFVRERIFYVLRDHGPSVADHIISHEKDKIRNRIEKPQWNAGKQQYEFK